MRPIRSIAGGLILLLATATPAAEVSITQDVVYGHKAGMALVYDVFQPAGHNGAAVLFMVSGGWISGWVRPEQRRLWFAPLLNAGFTVFAVQHGSSPYFKVPDAVADVRRAVRHVRANAARFDIDGDRLGAMGSSAGGHLSLMLGLASDEGDAEAADPVLRASNRVQAVVAWFPPVDLRDAVGPNENFPALDFDPSLARDVSPIAFVSDDDPPVLMIHGDEDRLVPLDNSKRMQAALDKVGVANKVVVIEGARHGFRGEERARAGEATVAFLEKHVGSAP